MIEIKYNKGELETHIKSNLFELIEFYAALLDMTEDLETKFAFKMAGKYRKDRDAKNNSGN